MHQTNQQPAPAHLSDITLPIPRPTKGCDVCGALMNQWRRASGTGVEYSPQRAEQYRAEILAHPHRKGAAK